MKFPENTEIFVNNLCFLRKKYAMSRRTLASLTGISLPILRMIERREVQPRLSQPLVERLCRIFDVTPTALLESDLIP